MRAASDSHIQSVHNQKALISRNCFSNDKNLRCILMHSALLRYLCQICALQRNNTGLKANLPSYTRRKTRRCVSQISSFKAAPGWNPLQNALKLCLRTWQYATSPLQMGSGFTTEENLRSKCACAPVTGCLVLANLPLSIHVLTLRPYKPGFISIEENLRRLWQSRSAKGTNRQTKKLNSAL